MENNASTLEQLETVLQTSAEQLQALKNRVEKDGSPLQEVAFVVEGRRSEPVTYDLLAVDIQGTPRETVQLFTDSKTRQDPENKKTYATIVRDLQSYRYSDPEFQAICFRRPIDMGVTPLTVKIMHPYGVDEADFRDRVAPLLQKPFDWVSRNLNVGKKARGCGMGAFLEWTFDSLLETALAGWEFAWGPVSYEELGIPGSGSLILPIEGIVYSGQSLELTRSGWEETWTVYKDKQEKFVAGDTDKVYQDLLRINWRPGEGYPYPYYTALRDVLRLRRDLAREENTTIAALNNRERIWFIDIEKIKALNLPAEDVKDEDGTVVQKGVVTMIKEAIRSHKDKHGYKEWVMVKLVDIVEQQPDTTALLDKDKYNEGRRRLHGSTGLLYDERGELLQQESTEAYKSFLNTIREHAVESGLYRLSLEMLRRNANFFVYRATEWDDLREERGRNRNLLRSPRINRDPDRSGPIKERQAEIEERMAEMRADSRKVKIYWEFAPLTIDPAQLKQIYHEMARLGQISTETLLEMLGFVRDVEEQRLIREKETTIERPDFTTRMPVHEPPMAFVQGAESDRQRISMRTRQGELQDEKLSGDNHG